MPISIISTLSFFLSVTEEIFEEVRKVWWENNQKKLDCKPKWGAHCRKILNDLVGPYVKPPLSFPEMSPLIWGHLYQLYKRRDWWK